jgi:hypothetical protein
VEPMLSIPVPPGVATGSVASSLDNYESPTMSQGSRSASVTSSSTDVTLLTLSSPVVATNNTSSSSSDVEAPLKAHSESGNEGGVVVAATSANALREPAFLDVAHVPLRRRRKLDANVPAGSVEAASAMPGVTVARAQITLKLTAISSGNYLTPEAASTPAAVPTTPPATAPASAHGVYQNYDVCRCVVA